MVNLEWYRTFKTIYKTGTLTGTAEALFISQPGVSLHLSSLESYVGYKLFERAGRKMVPTERGKILYNAVIDSLNNLEIVEKSFQRSTEKNTPTISIGMCFETFQITLEQYIATLPFNVIIRFGEYPEMHDQLSKGILDLIITPQKLTTDQLHHEAFSSEQLILVGGKDTDEREFHSRIAENDNIAAERWLMNQKWYGTTGDMEHLFRFWQQNFSHSPDFRPNYIVPNLNSIVRCLSSGQGLAVIPDFLFQGELQSGAIKLIWPGYKPLKNILYFASRKNSVHENEIELIKSLFRKLMAQPDEQPID